MFGTNHLGHFALVARLLPVLAPDARIVTTGSFAAKTARLDFDDLQSKRDYEPKRAYERSKLAQMLFALELDRRWRAGGSNRLSVLAHPGGALDSRPPVQTRTAGAVAARAPRPGGAARQGRRRAGRRPRGAGPGRRRRAAVGPARVRPAGTTTARTALGKPGRPRRRRAVVGGKRGADGT
jgi:NAD(P)-dependent dehydrogenase (short-subunit alcohol dehydrogenase family)